MAATLVRDLRANLSLGMSDDEFNREMDKLKGKAPAQGEAVAGAFSKAFSRQLGQAFRSLPQAQIDADTSDANVKVNLLRQSLRDLANKKIGVDIDSATALGEMRAIKAELESLKDTADIAVKADVTKALAALGVVEHEVEKLDGRDVDIDVNIKGAPVAAAGIGALDGAIKALSVSGPLGIAAVGGAIAALPIAASVAGNAVTFALGGALAAVGLAASQGSATAQAAISRLKTAAQTEAREIGQPFEKVWVTIVDVAQRELDTIGPHIRDSLADLAPTVQDFTDDAGRSLEELTPAIDGVEGAFKVMLQSLGPAMPAIMHDLADGILAITDAVARNPEALTRMVRNLASLVELAGQATGKLIDFAAVLQHNGAAVQEAFGAMNLPIALLGKLGFGLSSAKDGAEEMTQATQRTGESVSFLDQRLAGLIGAFNLVGSDGADAAQQLMDSWSQTFQQMTSVSSVMDRVQAETQAGIAAAQRQAAARRQLDAARASATERIGQAEDRLADTSERAAERIKQADRQLADSRERAADQVAAANARVTASREAVTAAEERAADQEAQAAGQVEDARRRAADVAESSGARIEDAAQRVTDAEQAAADHQADAEQRVRDAHERTLQAVEDLTAARKRAKDELEDLARTEAESAQDIEGAEIALERARERRDKANADDTSSPLDRREADFAFREAAARLEEVKRRAQDLTTQLQAAAQAGVEGSAEVMQASARVADAKQAEQDASDALAKQQIADARSVSDAVKALADAQRDASRQQEDAARSLAQAEADLAKAQVDGAKDVQAAKASEAEAEKTAAKASKDAAQDVKDAQADARKARQDAAKDAQDAEAAVAKARRDSAADILAANQAVKDSLAGLGGQAHVTTEQFLAELEHQVKDTENWAANLTALAGRVPAEMVEKLRALGPGSADVVAMAAKMSDPELKKFVDLMSRSGKSAGDQFSQNLAGAISANPQNVKVGLQDLAAREAFNRLINDMRAAAVAGVTIGVTLGASSANGNIFMANGAVLSFAGGSERHVAQISSPGTRVWSEPETQGEGYIPLALSKRARSEQILSQIADRFGGAYVKHQPMGSLPVMGSDGAAAGGGGLQIGQLVLNFADDRDMYAKGMQAAAGLREYARRGGRNPFQ